jgi:hypothetical protein
VTEFEENLDSLLIAGRAANNVARENLRKIMYTTLRNRVETLRGDRADVMHAVVTEVMSQSMTGASPKGPTLMGRKRTNLMSLLNDLSPAIKRMDASEIFRTFGKLKAEPIKEVLVRLFLKEKGHVSMTLTDRAEIGLDI